MRYWSGSKITKPIKFIHDNVILVVGTNPEGRHGLGLAKVAHSYWGAEYGVGRGISGRCYLLVTKNLKKNYVEKETGIIYKSYGEKSVSKEMIKENIREMYNMAKLHQFTNKLFVVPYVLGNNNLNGYSSADLVKLFTSKIIVPQNIVFHNSWKNLNKENKNDK